MMIKSRFLEEFEACKIPKAKQCKLEELASPTVFCVDKIAKQLDISDKKHCDEIVFYNTKKITRIYCIENKKGKHKILSKIKKQLQGGANIIEERLSDSEKFSFMPVLVAPGILPNWRHLLLGTLVTCANQERHIRHVISGRLLPPHSDKPAR